MQIVGFRSLTLISTLFAASFAFASTWTPTGAPSNQWFSVASSADGMKLAVAGDLIPIYTSTNSGLTWKVSDSPTLEWFSIASSADGCRMIAATPNTNILTITNLGGIYISTNSGGSWAPTSAPPTNWFAVASSPDGSKLAAAVGAGADLSPSSAAAGPIFTSTNSGGTWTATHSPTEFWSCIALSADGTKLIAGVANASSVSPVFFSTNSGSTWVQAKLPTNVNWSAVACSADGSKWMAANLPTVESVPPFILPGALYLSLDQGATWKSNNLPSISWHGVALSADGGKAVAMAQNGAVYTSTDQGTNWTSSTVPAQPCWAIASSADANRLVVAIDFVSSSTGGGIYISQTTNSPVLQIAAADNQAILSWLIPSTKFLLQQSPDLISWSTVTNKPILNVSTLQDQVTLPSSAASDFFRLRTP